MFGYNVVTNSGAVYYTVAGSPKAAVKRAGVDPATVVGLVWSSNRRQRPAGLYGTGQLSAAQLAEYPTGASLEVASQPFPR